MSTGHSATTTVVPNRPLTLKLARTYFAVVAAIGTAAVLAELAIAANRGGVESMVDSLSTMTYWTNILVAVIGWALVINPQRDGRIFRWLRLSSLVMITCVGLVYPLVLAAKSNPTGYEVYTNLAVHYIIPSATVLGWLVFGPRPRFTLRTLAFMPILPILYTGYAMLYGAVLNPTGEYPYPQLNPATGHPAQFIAKVMVTGLAFGFIYWGIDRALSKGAKPTKLVGNAVPEQLDATNAADAADIAGSDATTNRVAEKV